MSRYLYALLLAITCGCLDVRLHEDDAEASSHKDGGAPRPRDAQVPLQDGDIDVDCAFEWDAEGASDAAGDPDADGGTQGEQDAASASDAAPGLDADCEEFDANAPLDAASELDTSLPAHDATTDGPEAGQGDGSTQALCSTGTFTPRPLVTETFEISSHEGEAAWEGPSEPYGIMVDGNVLMVVSDVTMLPSLSDVPIGAQPERCAITLAEWDGTTWHEVFRRVYGDHCASASLQGTRAAVFDGTRQAVVVERGTDGTWRDVVFSGAYSDGALALDGDRLAYETYTNELAIMQRSPSGWTSVQTLPAPALRVTAEAGVLFLNGDTYRWDGSQYVPHEIPIYGGPNDNVGYDLANDSEAHGDCADNSSSPGVCADPSDTAAPSSGAVRLFGAAAAYDPRGLYIKPAFPDPDDRFCFPSLRKDALLVFAWLEDSSATGLDGDQSLNDAPDTGAYYLFLRDEYGWNQHHYIKAPSGSRLALSSERLAVMTGSRVVLYRFAAASPPSYVAPCERDGALLPLGTVCYENIEPDPLCYFAPSNGCTGAGLPSSDRDKRTLQRTCSGLSSGCDGPASVSRGYTYCMQDWDPGCGP